tara:strand:+ start:360 stop:464 length:105 start_codon:yes stop_codon:yes gene_type:complete
MYSISDFLANEVDLIMGQVLAVLVVIYKQRFAAN